MSYIAYMCKVTHQLAAAVEELLASYTQIDEEHAHLDDRLRESAALLVQNYALLKWPGLNMTASVKAAYQQFHELRAPLVFIQNYCALALDGELHAQEWTPERRALAEQTQISCNWVTMLIDGLMNYWLFRNGALTRDVPMRYRVQVEIADIFKFSSPNITLDLAAILPAVSIPNFSLIGIVDYLLMDVFIRDDRAHIHLDVRQVASDLGITLYAAPYTLRPGEIETVLNGTLSEANSIGLNLCLAKALTEIQGGTFMYAFEEGITFMLRFPIVQE
jgi:hypothetical protein